MNDRDFKDMESAIIKFGRAQYSDGVKVALLELQKVHGWLTRKPDRKWQKEVRKWVEQEIDDLKNTYNIDK